MIIVMNETATMKEVSAVIKVVEDGGATPHVSKGKRTTVVGVIGDKRGISEDELRQLPGVDNVVQISKPYKVASREFHPEDTIVHVGNEAIGGGKRLVVIAGPCSVESREQLMETAWAVKEAGATLLRGGAYKPRTSPYAFKGLGVKGLELLAEARQATGMPIVTELMASSQLEPVLEMADMIQVGARNMQNFSLLEELGKTRKPILLKRGMMSTMEELLMSAEYILSYGNQQVVLCERGIRTFETYTRNTLDISAVPVLKRVSHLPIIVDPSHAAGKREFIPALTKASVAAGADGLIIEVHPHPEKALSDGPQAMLPEDFYKLLTECRKIAEALGMEMSPALEAAKV